MTGPRIDGCHGDFWILLKLHVSFVFLSHAGKRDQRGRTVREIQPRRIRPHPEYCADEDAQDGAEPEPIPVRAAATRLHQHTTAQNLLLRLTGLAAASSISRPKLNAKMTAVIRSGTRIQTVLRTLKC